MSWHPSSPRRASHARGRERSLTLRDAFSLVELLVVIAVIGVLASLLLPALSGALVRAKVAKAHTELHQIGLALVMYQEDHRLPPPARTFCAGRMQQIDDYNALPDELVDCGYLARPLADPFNRPHSYKYVAPGFGWANGDPTILPVWVPDGFPAEQGRDRPHFDPRTSPVKWAIWSVGPGKPPSVFESDSSHCPVPEREWYPHRRDGIIVHLQTADGLVQSP